MRSTTRRLARGERPRMKDFGYYRCFGTDPYRFRGEHLCSSSQIQAEKIETVVWERSNKFARTLTRPEYWPTTDLESRTCPRLGHGFFRRPSRKRISIRCTNGAVSATVDVRTMWFTRRSEVSSNSKTDRTTARAGGEQRCATSRPSRI